MNEATRTETHGVTEHSQDHAVHDAPGGHTEEHAHPGSGEYIRVALILGVITAIEVAIYYFDLNKFTLVTALFLLSAAKFALVALFFMHLKFDNKIFSTFFAGGLVMAILAFIAVLAMFRVIV